MEQTATPISAFGKMQSAEPLLNSAPVVRYVIYARKSTEQDEKQALSIDSQIKEMLKIAERDRLDIADIRKESHSAKDSGQRPVFNQLIADIKSGKFNGILTWAPDRLSRNAGDLGALVDLMDQKALVEIRTYGQRFTNSPNEKFLLMILGAQGKLENDQKGLNVKRGQRARCEMGLWPAPAPTGYLNEKNRDKKCHVLVDPKRAPIIKEMFEKVGQENWSGKKVYRWMSEIKFTSINEKPLTLSNVYILLKNTFYYGVFQYPKKSGNWYTGIHQPLINKELYDKVQEQLKRSEIMNPWGSKELAFTKLITCGYCGATITADEKLRKLKNGGVNRHVYYSCSKRWQNDCKCGYIKEEDLIEQLTEILDVVKLDKIGVREKIEKEIGRYRKFQMGVLGINEKENQKAKDIDIRNYAKYILKEGEIFEKRELLFCLKSKLILKNKLLTLQE
ncbi:MAG: recombinase family protein [bacterium]